MEGVLTHCPDGSCCCLTPRCTVAIISIISLLACVIEVLVSDTELCICCHTRDDVETLRSVLLSLFQMANWLLLLASIVESALLLQIYIWYILGFIVLAFIVTIMEFLYRMRHEGAWSFVTFIPEVMFLFVTYRCLPLVDSYRILLEGVPIGQ